MANELTGTAIVIDDDVPTVNLLSEFLEIKGMEVIGKGYSGKEAVELYQKLRPDLVFLDMMMPYFDGLYALEKIRKMDRKARIIVITADLSPRTAAAIDKFQTPYIYKPYDFDELVKIAQKLLRPEKGF